MGYGDCGRADFVQGLGEPGGGQGETDGNGNSNGNGNGTTKSTWLSILDGVRDRRMKRERDVRLNLSDKVSDSVSDSGSLAGDVTDAISLEGVAMMESFLVGVKDALREKGREKGGEEEEEEGRKRLRGMIENLAEFESKSIEARLKTEWERGFGNVVRCWADIHEVGDVGDVGPPLPSQMFVEVTKSYARTGQLIQSILEDSAKENGGHGQEDHDLISKIFTTIGIIPSLAAFMQLQQQQQLPAQTILQYLTSLPPSPGLGALAALLTPHVNVYVTSVIPTISAFLTTTNNNNYNNQNENENALGNLSDLPAFKLSYDVVVGGICKGEWLGFNQQLGLVQSAAWARLSKGFNLGIYYQMRHSRRVSALENSPWGVKNGAPACFFKLANANENENENANENASPWETSAFKGFWSSVLCSVWEEDGVIWDLVPREVRGVGMLCGMFGEWIVSAITDMDVASMVSERSAKCEATREIVNMATSMLN